MKTNIKSVAAKRRGQKHMILPVASLVAFELSFLKEEVFSALSSLHGDKAPSLDGSTLALWQGCWDAVKNEVLGFFGEFLELGSFERSLNVIFLVLVPQKGGIKT